MNNMRGGGNAGKGDRKAGRKATQQATVQRKGQLETDFYWQARSRAMVHPHPFLFQSHPVEIFFQP